MLSTSHNLSLTILNFNARSLCNKSHLFHLEISKLNCLPDLLCITEHWFKNEKAIPIQDYSCTSFFSRKTQKGGGASIYVRKEATGAPCILFTECNSINSLGVESVFEVCAIKVQKAYHCILTIPLIIVSIYSNPSSNKDVFFRKFEELLDMLRSMKCRFFLCGDFNVDTLDKNNIESIYFLNLLSSTSLAPIFDIVPSRVTKSSKTLIDNCIANFPVEKSCTFDPGLSDHRAQIVNFNTSDVKCIVPRT